MVSQALWRLDRATRVAWKAVHLAEGTDDHWQLVKLGDRVGRGWEAADRLVPALDLGGQELPANLTP